MRVHGNIITSARLAVTALFSCGISVAAAEPVRAAELDLATTAGDVLVPAGVVYKPATVEANESMQKKLQQLFSFASSDEEITGLIGATPTIVGAALWNKLVREKPDLQEKLNTPAVKLMLPKLDNQGNIEAMQQMDATVIRSSAEAKTFWQELERMIRKTADAATSPTVRKLTTHELSIYWAMIPFEIEEPVFIVEVGDHHILVNTPGKQESAIWIDDLKKLGIRVLDADENSTTSEPLLGVPGSYEDPTTGRKTVAVWEESEPQPRDPSFETNKGKATLDNVRFLAPVEIVEANVAVEELVKISGFVDERLEKLADDLDAQHKVTVVVVLSTDAKPHYRLAVEPALSETQNTKLTEMLKHGPNVRSKSDELEISLVFLIKK